MIMMMMDNNNITRSAHLAAPPRLIPASSSLFTFIFRRILIIVALILAHESTQVFASSSSLAERCSASLQCADEPGNGQLLLHQQQQVPSNKEPLPVVCGSDGKTYASPCHLRTCGEPHVVIKHRGRCPSEVNTCQSQRAAVLGSRRTASPMDILPDCSEKDPNFWKPVQCHQATEYCWCVMAKDGKVVPGSSVRHRKPDCERLSRRRSNRRSARKGTGSSQGKMCTTSERLTFVFNLLAIFKSEFGRAQPAGKSVSSVTERRVINWKFRQLDANRDNGLRRKEVQDLKRMIKKLVQPRACAKLFARTTDANGDQIISRHEWNMYFKLAPQPGLDSEPRPSGGDASADRGEHRRPPSALRPDVATDLDADQDEDDYERRPNPLDFLAHMHSRGGSGVTSPGGGGGGGLLMLSESSRQDEEEEDEDEEALQIETHKDCQSARASAFKENKGQAGGRAVSFVPECTPAGLYRDVQCRENFCWCVDPNFGSPMRGSTVSNNGNGKPDCRQAKAVAARPQAPPPTSPPSPRPFENRRNTGLSSVAQGCSAQKKQRFLNELVDAFEAEMLQRNKFAERGREAASKWRFESVDTNRNGLLEKREWKELRAALRPSNDTGDQNAQSAGQVIHRMRKCIRNFLRGCDVNMDKRITGEEWFDCTGVTVKVKHHPMPSASRRLRGPNPFSTILKGD